MSNAIKTEYKKRPETLRELVDAIHSDPDFHLSHSAAEAFFQSPRHFVEYKLKVFEPTKAMYEGIVIHEAILEPDVFDEKYKVFDGNKPSSPNQQGLVNDLLKGLPLSEAIANNYKKAPTSKVIDPLLAYADFLKGLEPHQQEIEKSLHDMALMLRDRAYSDEHSKWLLNQVTMTEFEVGNHEDEMGKYWEAHGFKWRGRADMGAHNLTADLKIVADASPDKISREVRYGKMGRQSAHYCIGGRCPKPYYILAIERNGHLSVTQVTDSTMQSAWQEIEHRIKRFRACMFRDAWGESYSFWSGINEV